MAEVTITGGVKSSHARRVSSSPEPTEVRLGQSPLPGRPASDLERLRLGAADEALSRGARLSAGVSAIADGTFRVGPKHTWHAIKAKPLRYAMLLGGLGAAGAGLMAAGVNPAPYTIGLSLLVCGWATYCALPEMRSCQGPDRLRSIGANALWPAALCVGTAVGGHPLGIDAPLTSAGPTDLLKAGAQTVVIGADMPTIVQTVLDVPEGARAQRKFRRWLFGRGPAKAPDSAGES